MSRVARFLRVSDAQFAADWRDAFPGEPTPDFPGLPRRATAGSAGYDFFAPKAFELRPGETVRIPTGVRARIDAGWVLMLFPRSGLGFRHQVRLSNTVGIIDSDYAFAENEGHIQVSLRNPMEKDLVIGKGERFCQGILLPYGQAAEEETFTERRGGMGSTGA